MADLSPPASPEPLPASVSNEAAPDGLVDLASHLASQGAAAVPAAGPVVSLVLLRKHGNRRRFDLTRDEMTIGRREDCELRIPLGDVSRKHCVVHKVVDKSGSAGELQVVVRDLGSSNGTYVNNRRVNEASMSAGDVLRIGSLNFLLQVDGLPEDPPPDAGEFGSARLPDASDALNPTAQVDAADAVGLSGDDSGRFAPVDGHAG